MLWGHEANLSYWLKWWQLSLKEGRGCKQAIPRNLPSRPPLWWYTFISYSSTVDSTSLDKTKLSIFWYLLRQVVFIVVLKLRKSSFTSYVYERQTLEFTKFDTLQSSALPWDSVNMAPAFICLLTSNAPNPSLAEGGCPHGGGPMLLSQTELIAGRATRHSPTRSPPLQEESHISLIWIRKH